ncbi:hypothetical protein [Lonepinella sp. MS14436]|uniref:hypothetical protein n=1 Tax=Lonepinella sp. MS14436 TaxID=3003619 RepID=UPI0036DF5A75
MLYIPKTTPETYVSSIVALNIHSPEGTGDWHSAASLNDDAFPLDFYLYGSNQKRNTNHLLGQLGIIDGTQRLNRLGYYPENSPVWVADHPRACVDYLYSGGLQTGIIDNAILDDWFPSFEDKQTVYALLDVLEPKLNSKEKENLNLWKRRNPLE